MVEEVKYFREMCAESLDRTVHDADASCPPVDCSDGCLAGERSTPEEIHLYLLAIGERLRQHVAEVGHRHELTAQQAMVLDRLVARQSMGQLAGDLACDPSNVTGLIRRLEQRGLVAREPDETDRRTKWLSLTPAGEELRNTFRREIFQGSEFLTALGEGDQGHLLDMLRGILTSLEPRPS